MKFNTKTKIMTNTVNRAGGVAFKESDKLALVTLLLTSFVQDQFYRSSSQTVKEIGDLVTSLPDKKFAAQAALYARNTFGMRSVAHVVTGELAHLVKGASWSRNFYEKIVSRPDDMSEILAYYLSNYGKPIPNALKKGFASALIKFDDYQLAKYRGERAMISLVDVVNLVHPQHTDAIKRLIDGTLRSENTWESELTRAGQKAENDEQRDELKKEVWVKLISSKKIGYFALLRNLRNILEQAPEILGDALSMLVDEKLIERSKVMPFRYMTAIDEISKTNMKSASKVIVAINKALELSLKNVPQFSGETLVVLDTSGSMGGRPAEIGSLFAATLIKTNDCDFMTFSDIASYKTLNTTDSVGTLAQSIKFADGGTNFHAIFEEANKAYDRIIILSDMQGWVGYDSPAKTYNAYKKRVGAEDPIIYSIDLAGYGSLQFPEKNVYCLAGFSEKIFDVMKLLESDRKALITEIESVEI